MINKNFIDYTILLLFKEKSDHIFSFMIFTFIIFILSSVLFISDSIQHDLIQSIKNQPEVVVENTRAGREYYLHDGHVYDILKVAGVSDVEGSIDGYYYFGQKDIWFRIVGDDSVEENEIVVGQGIKDAMEEFYYKDKFNFITEELMISVDINKALPLNTNIISNDLILMNPVTARKVLGLEDNEYSKLYVSVPNIEEAEEVAMKIIEIYPNVKAVEEEEAISNLQHIFYYKGGIFMILYVVSMISFFILLKNQISLVYGEKKKEIAILRSIGYSIKDIIALKFIQNIVVSVGAYLLGVAMAYVFVFIFNAPFFRTIFLGGNLTNSITFTPVVDFKILFLVFLFGVIPFLAFVIIPSWKIAISDMSEAMK